MCYELNQNDNQKIKRINNIATVKFGDFSKSAETVFYIKSKDTDECDPIIYNKFYDKLILCLILLILLYYCNKCCINKNRG